MKRALPLIVLLAACGGASDQNATAAPHAAWATLNVSWTQPTLNVDGTALTNIASYRVTYGKSIDTLNKTVAVPFNQLSAAIPVPRGTYFVSVTTVNALGEASAPSGIATADLR